MKKKVEISREELLEVFGASQRQYEVEQRIDELMSPILRKVKEHSLEEYIQDDDFPIFDKVVGENDLTAKEVFILGGLAVLSALKDQTHKDYKKDISIEMLIELVKESEKREKALLKGKKVVKGTAHSHEDMVEQITKEMDRMKIPEDVKKEILEFMKETK